MKKIEVISESRDYDKYFKIDEAIVKETDSETGEEVTYSRYKLTRPDAVTAVVYNSSDDTVILVRQHRYPVDNKVDEDVLELVAGKIDDEEDPKDAILREIKEEIGFEVREGKIALLNSFFASPGYSSEMVHLFLAFVDNSDNTSEGGGVEGEHENIKIESYSVNSFFEMIANGDIVDSKTLIGAQALWHFRNREVVEAGRQFIEKAKLEHAKKIANQVIDEKDADETSE